MQRQESYPGRGGDTWAIGFTLFASIMMVLVGSFHFLEGLSAVVNEDLYVVPTDFALRIGLTTWGWLNMAAGVVVFLAGAWLFTGSRTARIITVVVAGLSTIWSFYSIPYQPAWSVMTIALNLGIIWALTTHTEDFG